jgi:hypothetical protein
MVAADCAVSWPLLGLSFSFPNWPEFAPLSDLGASHVSSGT